MAFASLFDAIKDNGFYIGEQVMQLVLREAGENWISTCRPGVEPRRLILYSHNAPNERRSA